MTSYATTKTEKSRDLLLAITSSGLSVVQTRRRLIVSLHHDLGGRRAVSLEVIGWTMLLTCMLHGQVVEEFVIPDFVSERQPLLKENVLFVRSVSPSLYAVDVSRVDGDVVLVTEREENRSGVFVSGGFVCWFQSFGTFAKTFDGLRFSDTTHRISDRGFPIAAHDAVLYFRVSSFDPGPDRNRMFMVNFVDIETNAALTPRYFAEYRTEPRYANTAAASEEFFVWTDRGDHDPWNVHVRRQSELLDPDPDEIVIATNLSEGFYAGGVFVDLHDSLLVYLAGTSSGLGVYFVDLRSSDEPVALATHESEGDFLYGDLRISRDYVVWSENTPDAIELVAAQLENGRPNGNVFNFGAIVGTGSRVAVDGNLVAWNTTVDVTIPEGTFQVPVIGFAEFEAPWAGDVGDVDQDGVKSLTDAIVLLNYLFGGGWRPRLRLGDIDSDRSINLSDAVYLLNYLFLSGPDPR